MSILKVDTINEKTVGNGVAIPGHVIQTVFGPEFSSERTSTSSSFALFDSGLAATITPKSSTSKILVTCTIANLMLWNNAQDTRFQLGISRDSASSFVREFNNRFYDYGASGGQLHYTPTLIGIDSPSSTSALTYNLYVKVGVGNVRINDDQASGTTSGTAGACFSQFILQEIAQ